MSIDKASLPYRPCAGMLVINREGLVFVDGRVNASDRVIVEGVQKVREGQEIRLVQPRGAPAQDVRIAPSQAAADGE